MLDVSHATQWRKLTDQLPNSFMKIIPFLIFVLSTSENSNFVHFLKNRMKLLYVYLSNFYKICQKLKYWNILHMYTFVGKLYTYMYLCIVKNSPILRISETLYSNQGLNFELNMSPERAHCNQRLKFLR